MSPVPVCTVQYCTLCLCTCCCCCCQSIQSRGSHSRGGACWNGAFTCMSHTTKGGLVLSLGTSGSDPIRSCVPATRKLRARRTMRRHRTVQYCTVCSKSVEAAHKLAELRRGGQPWMARAAATTNFRPFACRCCSVWGSAWQPWRAAGICM